MDFEVTHELMNHAMGLCLSAIYREEERGEAGDAAMLAALETQLEEIQDERSAHHPMDPAACDAAHGRWTGIIKKLRDNRGVWTPTIHED